MLKYGKISDISKTISASIIGEQSSIAKIRYQETGRENTAKE
jgi:hypothetical protein